MGKGYKLNNEFIKIQALDLSKRIQDHMNVYATDTVVGHVVIEEGSGLSINKFGELDVLYGNSSTTACSANDIRLSNPRVPLAHASTTPEKYGGGTNLVYGHVKLTDDYTTNSGDASTSIAASSKCVYDMYNRLKTDYPNWV